MGRVAWLDPASGAAGDMLLAAAVDAGRRLGSGDVEKAVLACVAALDLGCEVVFVEDARAGLRCLRAEVSGGQRPVGVDGLRDAILGARAPERATARALTALDAFVHAEATVHGVDAADVHLHELGEADTAVDLLGVAVALEALGVERLGTAPLPVPRGWVTGAHGALPLPAPVTLELATGLALEGVDADHELVTPTAVALLSAHGASSGPLPSMRLEACGVGGGTRDTPRPNICRLLVGDGQAAEAGPARLERDVLLETNIDDQSPEALAYATERLFAAGAKDVWVTPVVMKKSRPGFQVSVLADPGAEAALLEVLFRETTTLGVRRRDAEKWTLDRTELRVTVEGAGIRVKVARLGPDVVNVAPEHDDCAAVAARTRRPLKEIYREAMEAARRVLSG